MKKVFTMSLLLGFLATAPNCLKGQSPSWTTAGNDAICITNSTVRLVVKDDGTVWIGDGTGSQMIPAPVLFIDGHARAREIVVDMNVWPDYVFEEGYMLLSLDSVQRFISIHKRLPDVPSADSIAENGLSLAETNAVLMRKVEELQLYILQLNQRLNTLENEKQEAEDVKTKREKKKKGKKSKNGGKKYPKQTDVEP